MKHTPLYFFTVICICTKTGVAAEPTQTVRTPVGHFIGSVLSVDIRGKREETVAFRGIPYAKPPVGSLRFRKPVPRSLFVSDFDATKEGPACLQVRDPFHVTNITYAEDCLCLNVYVSSKTLASRRGVPVMIWIHGGGFVLGSSNVYVGDVLSSFADVVVVTINYRLAAFGFFSTGDGRASGNYGLWDQNLAIKWVHRNIAAFGGDPDRVTLVGQSSGGLSCILHALYPPNKGLFHRVIVESGGLYNEAFVSRRSNPAPFVQAAGCSGAADVLQCLRGKPAAELEAALIDPSFDLSSALFVPVIDGDLIVESPDDIFNFKSNISDQSRDFFATFDILDGVNSLDGAVFIDAVLFRILPMAGINKLLIPESVFYNSVIPVILRSSFPSLTKDAFNAIHQAVSYKYTDWAQPDNTYENRDQILNLASDRMYFVPSVETVQFHSILSQRTHSKTFQYSFIVDPTVKSLLPKLSWRTGANHGDEVLFVFGFSQRMMDKGALPCCATDAELRLSQGIMTLWSNFAKTG